MIVSPGECHRGAGHGAREPGAAPRRLTGMTSGSRTVLDSGHDGAVPLYLPLLRALSVTW